MMYRDSESRNPMSPQLALRVAIIGGVALVMFGIVFFRLWYLQVLSGDRYLAEANNNRVRDIVVQAPRGKIVDRNGRVLVDNRSGYAVKVNPAKLPKDPAARRRVFYSLSRVVGEQPRTLIHDVNKKFKAVPFQNATVQNDVPQPVYAYILEHQEEFPGVNVEQVFFRSYPHKEIGAHLFGTVGPVTADQLKLKKFRGVEMNDRVGQSGIESSYDRYLRGIDGADRVQVDAMGTLRGELTKRQPKAGNQLRLTVDYDVQQTGQQALAGQRGAFVAMDIHTGEIRGLGSEPSFDPNIFAKTIKQSDYDRLISPANGSPLNNRATTGAYPTGSTFKPITAVAALESGVIGPDTPYTDGGSFSLGPGQRSLTNAGHAAYGTIAMRKALQVSSDVFFYHLGFDLNSQGDGQQLQHWAAKLGIGRNTGIDIPAEAPGILPSRKYISKMLALHNKNPKLSLIDRPWSVGDNVNLAIGQGYLQANPLQMAVAYGAIANGGRVVRPHLGARVEDASGRAIQEIRAPAARKVNIQSQYRQTILDGLYAAAEQPSGTSYPVFGADSKFPIKVAGKTGTAQRPPNGDQSWYIALAPYPNPRYVVAVTVENGGWGAQTAAPAAKKIIGALFNVKVKSGGPVNLSGVNRNG
jgi:penicillin-binding protein 2